MFPAVLFTTAKIWKQSVDEWGSKMWYVQRNIIQPLKRKKKPSSLLWETWMNLEDIMLSEISQAQKNKECMISLTCGIWGVPGVEGCGNGKMLVKRYEDSFMQDE